MACYTVYMSKKPLKSVQLSNVRITDGFIHTRDSVFKRFPLLFTLMGTFGLVATLYGFEHLIDKIPLFVNNPYLLLATGILTLVVTGTLYKKL